MRSTSGGKTPRKPLWRSINGSTNAVLLGLHNLTVIHGKETGVLRENIQSFLRADKRVRTFRSGV